MSFQDELREAEEFRNAEQRKEDYMKNSPEARKIVVDYNHDRIRQYLVSKYDNLKRFIIDSHKTPTPITFGKMLCGSGRPDWYNNISFEWDDTAAHYQSIPSNIVEITKHIKLSLYETAAFYGISDSEEDNIFSHVCYRTVHFNRTIFEIFKDEIQKMALSDGIELQVYFSVFSYSSDSSHSIDFKKIDLDKSPFDAYLINGHFCHIHDNVSFIGKVNEPNESITAYGKYNKISGKTKTNTRLFNRLLYYSDGKNHFSTLDVNPVLTFEFSLIK